MKARVFVGTVRQTPVRHEKGGWVQAYERQMRRFNLAVISAALIALTLLIACWSFLK